MTPAKIKKMPSVQIQTQINIHGTRTGGDVKLPVQTLASAKATREEFLSLSHTAVGSSMQRTSNKHIFGYFVHVYL